MLEKQHEEIQLHQHIINGKKFQVVLYTVLLSILGYFLFTLWAGWENVVNAIKQVGPLGISVALILSLINYAMRFLRWHYFLHVLGYSIPWLQSLRIFMAGFSLTTTPGKTGEAIKGVFLKDYGVPFRKSFGAFLSERLSDLLAVTILASAGLWLYPAARPILLIVAAMIGFLLIAINKHSWLKALENLAKKILPKKFAHTIDFFLATIDSFRCCYTPKALLISLMCGIIAWTVEAMALMYIVHLLGFEISPLTAIFIYAFSLVIGGITLLPGGLGGAELTMLKLLTLQNIPTAMAVAATLVIRLTSLWFAVFLGMIALPKNLVLKNEKKHN